MICNECLQEACLPKVNTGGPLCISTHICSNVGSMTGLTSVHVWVAWAGWPCYGHATVHSDRLMLRGSFMQ